MRIINRLFRFLTSFMMLPLTLAANTVPADAILAEIRTKSLHQIGPELRNATAAAFGDKLAKERIWPTIDLVYARGNGLSEKSNMGIFVVNKTQEVGPLSVDKDNLVVFGLAKVKQSSVADVLLDQLGARRLGEWVVLSSDESFLDNLSNIDVLIKATEQSMGDNDCIISIKPDFLSLVRRIYEEEWPSMFDEIFGEFSEKAQFLFTQWYDDMELLEFRGRWDADVLSIVGRMIVHPGTVAAEIVNGAPKEKICLYDIDYGDNQMISILFSTSGLRREIETNWGQLIDIHKKSDDDSETQSSQTFAQTSGNGLEFFDYCSGDGRIVLFSNSILCGDFGLVPSPLDGKFLKDYMCACGDVPSEIYEGYDIYRFCELKGNSREIIDFFSRLMAEFIGVSDLDGYLAVGDDLAMIICCPKDKCAGENNIAWLQKNIDQCNNSKGASCVKNVDGKVAQAQIDTAQLLAWNGVHEFDDIHAKLDYVVRSRNNIYSFQFDMKNSQLKTLFDVSSKAGWFDDIAEDEAE